MKYFLSVVLLFFSAYYLSAQNMPEGGGQPQIKGKITGQLVDGETNEAVPYAAIVVNQGEKQINGTITEEDGSFKITELPIGKYTLQISFVGYENVTKEVELTPKNPDLDMGMINLTGSLTQLEEVVVEGRRELIENKIDKIVYNADEDVANAGGNASDVLRRAPLLNVDLEGNVSMRGSQNVRILINGKPSSMFDGNPGEALKSIPSDNIKSVEVITTPSAKYEGEGTAGIINIITKKNTPNGFSGNVDASVGNRQSRSALNINAGTGRFGFNSSISSFYSPEQEGSTSIYREDFIGDQSRILQEEGPNYTNRLGYFGNASAFYDFNAFHSLSTSFRLRGFDSDRESIVEGRYTDPINNITQHYERGTDTENTFGGYEWSLDYIYQFPESNGQELSVSYKIDGNNQDQEYLITQEDLEGDDPGLFQNERNINDGDNTENTIQIDYIHPFSDKVTLEAGGKTIFRDVTSDFSYDTLDITNETYQLDASRSDVFNYNQDVSAGYLSSTFKFGTKYGLIAGVRYEYTEIEGDFDIQDNPFENSYHNWLPSVTLSRKIGKFNTLKASYSRRIQRPSLRVINPYIQINNNRSLSYGNPELDPELTDQYEVSYGMFVKGASINASVFYRKTTEIIESFLTIDEEGVSTTTYRNIGENDSYGINLFSSVTLFDIVTIRGGLNIYTYNSEGTINGNKLSRDAVVWDGNLNGNIKFGKGWTVDMFGFYRAPRQTLQGENPSFSIFVMGAKKEINEKLSLGVRIVEPFFDNKTFGSELNGENFVQTSEFEIPFRSFGINLTYKFGKLDFKQRTRKSKINNQDQEDAGDGQQQQQF